MNTAAKLKRQKVRFENSAVFLDATENGELDVVKKCVEEGVSAKHANADGISGIHNAAIGGHLDVVKYLVQKGADIFGISFLFSLGLCFELWASTCASWGPFANINIPTWPPVRRRRREGGMGEIYHFNFWSFRSGSTKRNSFFDNIARDADQWTPLHAAASGGSIEVIDYLIELGANPHSRNTDNETPYDVAEEEEVQKRLDGFLLFDFFLLPLLPFSPLGLSPP